MSGALQSSSAQSERFNADLESSSEDYAKRFAGPLGRWLLEVQLQGTVRLLGSVRGQRILDFGGGHGQLAEPLSKQGALVTVLGSHSICAERLQAWLRSGAGEFVTGDLLNAPFADRSFDHVVAVRMVSHCPDWPVLIAELCRMSRVSVLIDYPPLLSFNLLYRLLFPLKKGIEGNTRTFLIFRSSEIVSEFAKHGFVKEGEYKQFFLPMVLHRMLKAPFVSQCLEGLSRALGLTALFGSPSLIRLKRQASG